MKPEDASSAPVDVLQVKRPPAVCAKDLPTVGRRSHQPAIHHRSIYIRGKLLPARRNQIKLYCLQACLPTCHRSAKCMSAGRWGDPKVCRGLYLKIRLKEMQTFGNTEQRRNITCYFPAESWKAQRLRCGRKVISFAYDLLSAGR